jgi:hypothetical protein
MPIASNVSHRSSSPKVLRKEWPGLVIIEIGYAVNQTDDFAIAAVGLGDGERGLPYLSDTRELPGDRARVGKH